MSVQTPRATVQAPLPRARQIHAAATSFLALFSIVGLALYGLPLFYDHMVCEFGWSRTHVTSGNALSKPVVGPLPNQVLLSRWVREGRGKAMGFAYLGIGLGGAAVPWPAYWLTQAWGWRGALRGLGVLIVVLAWPMAYLTKDAPANTDGGRVVPDRRNARFADLTPFGVSGGDGPVSATGPLISHRSCGVLRLPSGS